MTEKILEGLLAEMKAMEAKILAEISIDRRRNEGLRKETPACREMTGGLSGDKGANLSGDEGRSGALGSP
jgi:hypothetical protein